MSKVHYQGCNTALHSSNWDYHHRSTTNLPNQNTSIITQLPEGQIGVPCNIDRKIHPNSSLDTKNINILCKVGLIIQITVWIRSQPSVAEDTSISVHLTITLNRI